MTHTETALVNSMTHTETALVNSMTHTETALENSMTHTETALVKSMTHTLVNSMTHTLVNSMTHTETALTWCTMMASASVSLNAAMYPSVMMPGRRAAPRLSVCVCEVAY
jgi:hypothetical protein